MRARGFVNLRRHDGGDRTAAAAIPTTSISSPGLRLRWTNGNSTRASPVPSCINARLSVGSATVTPAFQMDRQTALIDLVRQARHLLDAFERDRGSVADTRGLPEQQSRSNGHHRRHVALNTDSPAIYIGRGPRQASSL